MLAGTGSGKMPWRSFASALRRPAGQSGHHTLRKHMTPDPQKAPAETTPPAPETGIGVGASVFVAAFVGTIALVWGYETTACDSVVAGAVGAVLRAGFLVLTDESTLVLFLLVFVACMAMAYVLTRMPPFRGREELLTLLLPSATFLLGLFIPEHVWAGATCALHPWW